MHDQAFYRSQHKRAHEGLAQIGSGHRFFRSSASGDKVDITEEHKATLQAQLEYWTARLFGQAEG